MSEDKEDKQRIWDELLLEGWSKDYSVFWLAFNFVEKIGEPSGNFLNARQKIEQMDIKRRFTDGSVHAKYPIKAMVDRSCPRLSNCLWSGKHSKESILEAIDRFVWKPPSKKFLEKTYREKRKRKTPLDENGKRTVKMRVCSRARDKRRDWGTVK